MNERLDDVYDDHGRWIRPAFAGPDNWLTIFRDHVSRRRYVERNGYVFKDGVWSSSNLRIGDRRDVIVRAEAGKDYWSVVPDDETCALRERVYGTA
jgi:hypothetical protein